MAISAKRGARRRSSRGAGPSRPGRRAGAAPRSGLGSQGPPGSAAVAPRLLDRGRLAPRTGASGPSAQTPGPVPGGLLVATVPVGRGVAFRPAGVEVVEDAAQDPASHVLELLGHMSHDVAL